MCYRGEEKHGEKREERQLRKRSMGRGEIRVSDSEGARREKVKGRDKSEKTYHEREKVPKNYVSHCYSWR